MYADFFGNFLDHHRLQLIDAFFQEILLPGDDAVTNFRDRLLALFNILDELDGALVALLHLVAGILVVGLARDQLLVGRIQA